MERLKRLKIFSIGPVSILLAFSLLGAKCKNTGDIKLYSLDVDNEVMRRDEGSIPFRDPRMRCMELPEGRRCEYVCISADDLEEILPPVMELE